MKFGFELEAFTFGADEHPRLTPAGLPMDDCGWLAEIRSEPHDNVTKAFALLDAERRIVEKQAKALGCVLLYEPLFEIPRDLKVEAARRGGKPPIKYRNLYGYQTHKNPTRLQTASLHISVTNEQHFTYYAKDAGTKVFNYPGFIDYALLVTTLDKAFKAEILKAKRNPGFYEVKSDGRIEYRSLPNDVDLNKVAEVLDTVKHKLYK